MINGHVVAHHILVNVPLRTPNQPEVEVAFVIDTGFTGFLTLPPAIVAALNLPFLRRISANLADGSRIFLSVYIATIVWDGTPRDVEGKSLRRTDSLCLARYYWLPTDCGF